MTDIVIPRDQAIRNAGRVLAQARRERDAKSPRRAAEDAWYRGHRLGTVDAIEALIIRQRAEALAAAVAAGTHLPDGTPVPRQSAA